MTLGFSRDDMGTFLPTYLSQQILHRDPFQELDTEGVGALIKMCVQSARAVNPDVIFGVSVRGVLRRGRGGGVRER